MVYMHTGFWVTIATFEMNNGWFLSPYSINPSREHVTTVLSCCDYAEIECPPKDQMLLCESMLSYHDYCEPISFDNYSVNVWANHNTDR